MSSNRRMEIVTELRLMYVSSRRNALISKYGEIKGVWLMWKPLLPKSLSSLSSLRSVKVGWGTQEAPIVKFTISCIYDLRKRENRNSFSSGER